MLPEGEGKAENVSKQRFLTFATKARRHKDLIFNELFLRAFVAKKPNETSSALKALR
jgi:hypothetical protein